MQLNYSQVKRLSKFPPFAAILDELRGMGKFKGSVTLTLSATRYPVTRRLSRTRAVEREVTCHVELLATVKHFARLEGTRESTTKAESPPPETPPPPSPESS